MPLLKATYVLPLAARSSQTRALSGYLQRLSRIMEDVIVVDGSPKGIFGTHSKKWAQNVRHIPPDVRMSNGKVAGVMTGVRAARHEFVIIADDDVRYRQAELAVMLKLLGSNDVVRPQNVFRPLPWHARWDTARSLLNRLFGGDWPGTLGVRRSTLLEAGGYSGEVLFENLELVRTVRAAGGYEAVALALFVERRPPSTRHFFSQRVRQAYDEWARPVRLAVELAILPTALILLTFYPLGLIVGTVCVIAVAELGRRRGNGAKAFSGTSALWAPLWLAERAVTSWIAFATRIFFGGIKYRDKRLKDAATPTRKLKARVQKSRTRSP